jgi:hypothetical protein
MPTERANRSMMSFETDNLDKKGHPEMTEMVFGKASDTFAGKEFAQGGIGIGPNLLILTSG